ncbi:Signal recognition particle subunit SRP72 [Umbelopsis nana]
MSSTDQLPALFGELERFVSQADYDKALKMCDKILNIASDDQDALHCKLITLIRLERYSDALALLARKFKGENKFLFERAYCLYRSNQLTQALEVIETAKKANLQDVATRHLEAQLNYRLENYDACLAVYRSLLDEMNDGEGSYYEVLANYNAVKASMLTATGSLDDQHALKDNTETYELAYNSACSQIAQGNLTKAQDLLESAKKICRESMVRDEYTEADIEQELAVIVVQLAYVYQLQGKTEQAIELYQSIVKSSSADPVVSAVVANNLVSAKKNVDLFDATKKLKAASAKELDSKLFTHQKRVIAMNEALLNLFMHKYNACTDLTQKLLEKYPGNDDLCLILAAVSAHQNKNSKALADLESFAKKEPQSLAIHFAIIQLQLIESKHSAALATLEEYLQGVKSQPELYYQPALIALLVWLYEQTGQSERAMQTLDDASSQWKSGTSSTSSKPPSSILKQTAAFKLKARRFQEAAADYEQLVKADPMDSQAIAGLITAYSEVNPALAEKYGNSLPAFESGSLDLATLERVVPGVKRRYVKKDGKEGSAVKKSKKNKKRKPLMPKQYDPKVTPDPERWLPKRERSTYKVKGKNKKALLKGSQGASVVGGGIGGTGSANIGGAKHAASPAEVAPEPQQEAVVTNSPKPKPAAKKKKKGKGGKW